MPLFTVFTPTYNREHTLIRVWDSLRSQTLGDFEWLVVDDGSTDRTAAMVAAWAKDAPFDVRYFRQENSGKHIAMNRAVREARGRFFITADSDDAFDPGALAALAEIWEGIPVSERDRFAGVTVRCRTQRGEFVGTPLPRPVFDSDSLELHYRYGVTGEKWGFIRRDVLTLFPFDETPDMGVFPWGRIAHAGYKTRYVDRVLRTYYVDESADTMSKGLTVKRPMTNVYRNAETLNLAWKYFWFRPWAFIRSAVNLNRFGQASGLSHPDIGALLEHSGAKMLVRLTAPLARLKPLKKAVP